MPWRFKDRLDARGENVIREWLDDLPHKAKAKIDGRLRNLELCEYLSPPFVEKIHGYEGVYEVRVVSFNVQYRPLGTFGPRGHEFTLILGAIEKGGRIEPTDAFQTAEDWIKKLGLLKVCDHVYDIDRD